MLKGVLLDTSRMNCSDTTSSDVAEPHMEAIEVSTMDKEYTKGARISIFGAQERSIESHCKGVPVFDKEVRPEDSVDCIEHFDQQRPSVFKVNRILDRFNQ
jgi:hypothetical protein